MRTSHRKLRLAGELNVRERSRPIAVLVAKAHLGIRTAEIHVHLAAVTAAACSPQK